MATYQASKLGFVVTFAASGQANDVDSQRVKLVPQLDLPLGWHIAKDVRSVNSEKDFQVDAGCHWYRKKQRSALRERP